MNSIARSTLITGIGTALMFASAQTPKNRFPQGIFTAKTIVVLNDTKSPAVEKGADDALHSWGQFKIVDDPQLADITVRFEKAHQHEGQNTQKQEDDGNTSYGYGVTFSSSITMKVFFKDDDKPFYETKTDDSKAKAGTTCINGFHSAFRAAYQQAQPR